MTHDVHDTLAFDRVLLLAEGAIVESGNPRALAAQPESRYGRMLREEIEARELWSESQTWRHLRLDRGEIAWQPPRPNTDGERAITAYVAPR